MHNSYAEALILHFQIQLETNGCKNLDLIAAIFSFYHSTVQSYLLNLCHTGTC